MVVADLEGGGGGHLREEFEWRKMRSGSGGGKWPAGTNC